MSDLKAKRDEKDRQDMMMAAARYADADKSDPFAYSRAVSHIRSGISGARYAVDGTREIVCWDANGNGGQMRRP